MFLWKIVLNKTNIQEKENQRKNTTKREGWEVMAAKDIFSQQNFPQNEQGANEFKTVLTFFSFPPPFFL